MRELHRVVGDVLHDVVADHHVHRAVGQRDLLHVEMQVGQRAFEIGRDILPRMRLEVGLEVTHDTDLGSNVQRARKGRQEIGFARQVEP